MLYLNFKIEFSNINFMCISKSNSEGKYRETTLTRKLNFFALIYLQRVNRNTILRHYTKLICGITF